MAVLREEKKKMNKGDPVRKTEDHKSTIKKVVNIIRKAFGVGRAQKRKDSKTPRLNFNGYGYKGRNAQKGAFGICKYLKRKA